MAENQSISIDNVEFLKWINDLDLRFLFYTTLIILPVSLFFNSMAIFIFLDKKFKKSTNWIHHVTLNTINNVLAILIFAIYFTQSINKDILLYSSLTCKLASFGLRVLMQQSSWIYVILVTERLLCVTHPAEYKSFKNKKLTLIIGVGVVFILICFLNTPNLLLNLEATPTNISASAKLGVCTGDDKLLKIRDMMVIVFRMGVPFMLTIALNTVLIIKLRVSRKSLRIRDRFMMNEYRFAFSIIVLNFLFIITLIPAIIALIYSNVVVDVRQIAIANFMRHVAQLIAGYNYFFNFFINFKTNALFRKEFFRLVNKFGKFF